MFLNKLTNQMKLEKITSKLDNYFKIRDISPDLPFGKTLPKKYNLLGIDFKKYFTEDFCAGFHGLAVKNSEEVNKIYLTVFLSGEILDKIFSRNEKDILVFSHHPMDLETNNRGTVPLAKKYFQEMKRRRISVYVLHTPLDINTKISTSGSVAKLVNLKIEKRYSENSGGYSGVVGRLPKRIKLNIFIKLLSELFKIKDIYFIKKNNYVHKVGIIAGGGSCPQFITETAELGCDTYLTGDYINNIKNDYGEKERLQFASIKDKLNINLIACSHYATEKSVLINEIRDFFKIFSIPSEFIEQDDPWK